MATQFASPVLSPIDADALMSAGLAGPVTAGGSRRIHKRRLNRSSDKENEDIPLHNADTEHAFVEIPSELISEATLKYLGYDDHAAARLWQKWLSLPLGFPGRKTADGDGLPFIEFATGHVSRRVDAYDEDDTPWFQCVNACGIASSTQNAIMDRVYKRIRLTQSCVDWTRDTMQLRYDGLKAIQRTSQERAMAISRAQTVLPASASTASSSGGGRRSESETQGEEPGLERETALSATALASQHEPGYTILYKGISQERTVGLRYAHAPPCREKKVKRLWQDFSATTALLQDWAPSSRPPRQTSQKREHTILR